MKERPILFSGEMVRAILKGGKTQTRRVIKPLPVKLNTGLWVLYRGDLVYALPDQGEISNSLLGIWDACSCEIGMKLWVRETWCKFPANTPDGMGENIYYRASQSIIHQAVVESTMKNNKVVWHPSIFMPRAYSRITLEIVNVRVEQVQDISYLDAIAEGVEQWEGSRPGHKKSAGQVIGAYMGLWDNLNAKRGYSWASNPWVWVIEFKRVQS